MTPTSFATLDSRPSTTMLHQLLRPCALSVLCLAAATGAFGATIATTATNETTKAKTPLITESDFRTAGHPRVYFNNADKKEIKAKIAKHPWAADIVKGWHAAVDDLVAKHKADPEYVVPYLQMHWEEGKHYTHFYTDGQHIPRREGNAKYPTIRVAFSRVADSPKAKGWRDHAPYTDGVYAAAGPDPSAPDGLIAFDHSGQIAENINGYLLACAYRAALIWQFEGKEDYAKFAADIFWIIVRGGAQQEQIDPHEEINNHGHLSWETLGDSRHFWAVPLIYDCIFDYLAKTYFDSPQFKNGLRGVQWAVPHPEGKKWAFAQITKFFRRQIENKLNRGGGLEGNWNMIEQGSAMLYALALEDDRRYKDGKGRGYYVTKLVYGPTTLTHGAYADVLRGNIDPATGLWPEAPGSYGQGSVIGLVKFGFIYWRNGIDLLAKDPLLFRAALASMQMCYPNGLITNVGDASYSAISTECAELMAAYAHAKGAKKTVAKCAGLFTFAPRGNMTSDDALFFYLGEMPSDVKPVSLSRVSWASVYPVVMERNFAVTSNRFDDLCFSLCGASSRMGHRHANGISLELYARTLIMAPDPGAGPGYHSEQHRWYNNNLPAHNTVVPNGMDSDNRRTTELEIVAAEPMPVEGGDVRSSLSRNRQFVEVEGALTHSGGTSARQRRLVAIVRSGNATGYFVDVFRSVVTNNINRTHDYIYHNMGWGSALMDSRGVERLDSGGEALDPASGVGYKFFKTKASRSAENGFMMDFDYDGQGMHMYAYVPGGPGRTVYALDAPATYRQPNGFLRWKPTQAFLVRQQGEAWERPFVAVYEPFGQGTERKIAYVESEPVKGPDGGGVKIVVHYLGDETRTDEIYVDCKEPFKVISRRGKKTIDVYPRNKG